MTKNLLLLLFIAVPLFLQAQNWQLMNAREVYAYSINGDTMPLFGQEAIKTIHTTALDTFVMNTQRVDQPVDTCTYNGLGYSFNKPFFMQQYIIHRPDSSWLLEGPRRNVVLPFAHSGSQWTFDTLNNIVATVIAEHDTLLFGLSDSVKIIQLVSPTDTNEIVLSKASGILKWPKANGGNYTLCGLGRARKGHYFPNIMDMYDWHPGDIFFYNGGFGSANMGSAYTADKVSVIGRLDYPDSILINVREYYIRSSGCCSVYTYENRNEWLKITPGIAYAPCFTCFWDQHILINESPLPSMQSIAYDYSEAPSTSVQGRIFSPIYFSSDLQSIRTVSLDSIYSSSYSGTYLFDLCSDGHSHPNDLAYYLTSSSVTSYTALYQRGLGIMRNAQSYFEAASSCELTAYRKDGVVFGNIPSDEELLSTASIATHIPAFHISPNPAHSLVNIQWTATNAPVETLFVQLTDLTGRTVKEQIITDTHTNQLTIPVNDLPAGVYCVHLVANGKETYTDKLIID